MKILSRPALVLSWIFRVVAAVILLQTLFFKFSGAEESVYIFSKIGAEPWGRYGSGVVELIAAVLLLTSCYARVGALLALGVISGALLSHLIVLGLVVKDDGGLLFGLACTVFVCSLAVLVIHREQIRIGSRFQKTHLS